MAWLSDSPDDPLGVEQVPTLIKSPGAPTPHGRERRRQVADELYHALVQGGYSFWDHIHPLFLNRDITRHDLRELVRRGLSVSRGNYRSVLELFGMPSADYKRFMNFLSTHDCRADYREFRTAKSDLTRSQRSIAPLLPPLPAAEQPSDNSGEPITPRSGWEQN
jgi:hypothetical protein